jgi:hypothetical protein
MNNTIFNKPVPMSFNPPIISPCNNFVKPPINGPISSIIPPIILPIPPIIFLNKKSKPFLSAVINGAFSCANFLIPSIAGVRAFTISSEYLNSNATPPIINPIGPNGPKNLKRKPPLPKSLVKGPNSLPKNAGANIVPIFLIKLKIGPTAAPKAKAAPSNLLFVSPTTPVVSI